MLAEPSGEDRLARFFCELYILNTCNVSLLSPVHFHGCKWQPEAPADVLVEFIVEKLKLLNYEKEFCKRR